MFKEQKKKSFLNSLHIKPRSANVILCVSCVCPVYTVELVPSYSLSYNKDGRMSFPDCAALLLMTSWLYFTWSHFSSKSHIAFIYYFFLRTFMKQKSWNCFWIESLKNKIYICFLSVRCLLLLLKSDRNITVLNRRRTRLLKRAMRADLFTEARLITPLHSRLNWTPPFILFTVSQLERLWFEMEKKREKSNL